MKFACTLLLCLAITVTWGQSSRILPTLQEAQQLAILLEKIKAKDQSGTPDGKSIAEFYRIFEVYGNYKSATPEILLKNPFLRKEDFPQNRVPVVDSSMVAINDLLGNKGKPEGVPVAFSKPVTTPESGFQAAIIDGTARFLSKRFKQEISAWYLNTLHGKLEKQKFVTILFPKTFKFLGVFANQMYNTDIALLQAAAESDIQNFPVTFFTAAKEIDALKGEEILLNTLQIGVELYSSAKRGSSIYEVLNTLPLQSYVKGDLKEYLQVLRILSNGLLGGVERGKGPWSDLSEIDLMDLDDQQVRFFYALLYEQIKKISINGTNFETYLAGADINNVAEKLSPFITKIVQLNQFIEQQMIQVKTKSVDYLGTLSRLSDLLSGFEGFLGTLPKPVMIPLSIKNGVKCLPEFYNLANSISNKQYSKVVPSLVILMNTLQPSIKNESIMVSLRYASVLAQFGEVENAEQMETLLEAVALPVGSASIKRKSNSNLSLNAYVGLAGGWEKASANASAGSATQERASLGLTAPIGLAYSFYAGKHANINKNDQPLIPSWSIFLSAFDIGNIVNVRFKSDTTSIGDLKFANFISLGLGFHANFKNSPFSAGINYSFTPAYRDFIADDKTWKYNADAHRIRLSLLVDIPVLNFYTRKKDE